MSEALLRVELTGMLGKTSVSEAEPDMRADTAPRMYESVVSAENQGAIDIEEEGEGENEYMYADAGEHSLFSHRWHLPGMLKGFSRSSVPLLDADCQECMQLLGDDTELAA